MSARANAAKVIDQLARKARPTPKPKRATGKLLYVVICPKCVQLGSDKTEHLRERKSIWCKEHAKSCASKAWAKRNRDRCNVARRARYHRNIELERQRSREAHQRHRPKRLLALKEYRESHRPELAEMMRAWREKQSYGAGGKKAWLEFVKDTAARLPAECF